jgi:two-component system chemotaxis response regulator CheY
MTSQGLPIHVMVIDDHKSMRSIIKNLLQQGGVRAISEAENGQDALEKLSKAGAAMPDVIICDLYMDKMDGMQFAHHLQFDRSTPYHHIPVLILTGEKDSLVLDVTRQAGAAKVLLKPISGEDLLKEVKSAIGFLG